MTSSDVIENEIFSCSIKNATLNAENGRNLEYYFLYNFPVLETIINSIVYKLYIDIYIYIYLHPFI